MSWNEIALLRLHAMLIPTCSLRADLKTLFQIVSAKVKGETQMDDKTMIMERTIKLVAGLPNHSKTQEILTNTFIDELWNSLDHPPMLYMGDQFKWRHADGSFNVSAHVGRDKDCQLITELVEPNAAEAWCSWTAVLEDRQATRHRPRRTA